MLADRSSARECATSSRSAPTTSPQYVLAMDRQHPVLARAGRRPAPGGAAHDRARGRPAPRDAGIWVGACGGIAGDPLGSVILAGLGVTELAASIPSVAATKALVRRTRLDDAEALARRALACRSADEVRALVPGARP